MPDDPSQTGKGPKSPHGTSEQTGGALPRRGRRQLSSAPEPELSRGSGTEPMQVSDAAAAPAAQAGSSEMADAPTERVEISPEGDGPAPSAAPTDDAGMQPSEEVGGAASDVSADAGAAAVPRRGKRRPMASAPAVGARTAAGAKDSKTSGADSKASTSKKKPGFPWGKWLLTLTLVGLGVALLAASAVYFTLEHVARDLPSVEKLKAGYNPPQITRILARDDTLLASVFTERRTVVPFDKISVSAKRAFLAAEDASFYEHEGLNYLGMLRALVANIRAGHTVQGGSTITQQVVKNVLLDSERSYRRKIREAVLSLRLEQSLSKDEIFWLYLNHIYQGHGRYGIEEAARYYFGKHASELALDEAAVLAGLVAAPERYSPRRDAERALARRQYVLDQMLKKGFVTPQFHEEVARRPLRLAPAEESESELAPEAVAMAQKHLRGALGGQELTGGFTLSTTIDPGLQAKARQAVRDNLDAYMSRHELAAPYMAKKRALWAQPHQGPPKVYRVYTGVVQSADDKTGTIDVRVGDVVGRVRLFDEARYNPKNLLPSKFTQPEALLRVRLDEDPSKAERPLLSLELGPQSALVALDVRSHEILALVGSYEAIAGGLDRATQAQRQPGSTFKPFVYSYALHSRRFTPATMIPVQKKADGVVEAGNGLFVSLRDSLTYSNNEGSTALLQQSGAPPVVQWARALGITSRLEPDLSLALGSYEVTPLELANAYATLASGGLFAETRIVQRVTTPNGEELPLPASPPERRVMEEEEAYLATSLMRSVVERGTGRAARSLGREVAGKTGTTNQAKDAWFAGFSTDIVAVVWVGYDDARPLGKRESGARTALPAWIDFMRAAHEGRPKTTFHRPGKVLELDIDPLTGLLPLPGQENRRREEFLLGTEPTEVAPAPDGGAPEPEQGQAVDAGPEPPPF